MKKGKRQLVRENEAQAPKIYVACKINHLYNGIWWKEFPHEIIISIFIILSTCCIEFVIEMG